jgi:ribosome-binding ATPase YchF (GTP1/OBG family)
MLSTAPQAAGVIHTDFEKDLFVPKLFYEDFFSTVQKQNVKKQESSK